MKKVFFLILCISFSLSYAKRDTTVTTATTTDNKVDAPSSAVSYSPYFILPPNGVLPGAVIALGQALAGLFAH